MHYSTVTQKSHIMLVLLMMLIGEKGNILHQVD